MRVEVDGNEIDKTRGNGLEIAVRGFKGDWSMHPAQIFIETDGNKLKVYVWDGTSEDPAQTFTVYALT